MDAVAIVLDRDAGDAHERRPANEDAHEELPRFGRWADDAGERTIVHESLLSRGGCGTNWVRLDTEFLL